MRKYFIVAIIILVLAIAGVLIYLFFPSKIEEEIEQIEVYEPELLYEIPIDSFKIHVDTVKSGETIGLILSKYGISGSLVHKIGQMSCDSFNLTLIKPGQKYSVFLDTISDTIPHTKYLVYENGQVNYTKYDFTYPDSVIASKHKKPVDTLQLTASGVIESSLWNALAGQDLSWELAIKLSQTFAWTVDFYGLQKNDYFKVIYTELSVEGKNIGNIEIEAAVFHHAGKEQWAIPFEQDSVLQFFDTTGMSMKKSFLKAPLEYTRVSSRYSTARMHPIHHRVRPHLAVDYSAPTGTPIYAASDGRIAIRTYGTGAGNYVKIIHNSIYATVYMHMSKFGQYNVGDYVRQGDVIGYVGSTGWSTGPHLHYEIHENGQKIDPLKFEAPPAEPIKLENMEKFNKVKNKWVRKINKIENPI
ncbi:MAG: peptidoglycan DD-metalloendopeptidase family protein [Bacteroidales bacterium]|nr:peptidoglycan DD-metalloendopeptidase family protein [Bacteroidales bacterium]